jgi:hypothetical protein
MVCACVRARIRLHSVCSGWRTETLDHLNYCAMTFIGCRGQKSPESHHLK